MSSISKDAMTAIEGISGDGNNRVRVEFRRLSLPSRRFLALLTLPMLLALGISAYLSYASFTASEVAGCSGGELFDCSHVLYSKWSKVLGFPVSAFAFLTYVGMILATAATSSSRLSKPTRLMAWSVVTGLALAAAMAALYFIYLQVFVLKHLCQWCLGAHTCGLIIAASVLLSSARIAWPPLATVSGLAAAGLAVMIGVQVNSKEPPKYVVTEYIPAARATVTDNDGTFASSKGDIEAPSEGGLMLPPDEDEDFLAPPEEDFEEDDSFLQPPEQDFDEFEDLEEGEAETASFFVPTASQISLASHLVIARSPSSFVMLLQQPVTQQQATADNKTKQQKKKAQKKKRPTRIIEFMGKKIDAHRWPIDGKPTAKHVFVEMFDYTCPHCRSTSQALFKVKEKMGDDLAVVVLPVPMKMACNPSVTRDHPVHQEACELSELAVAVWRCDASKFPDFHKWMFEGKDAPNYATALGKASELVGKDKITKELKKTTSKKYVQLHCQMYRMLNGGAVPKLLFPTRAVQGEFTAVEELATMIRQNAVSGQQAVANQ